MIVTGYEPAGRVTISNNEFNGKTSWSASCNGDHYWTMLFLGEKDQITLSNNYVHHCSGRAPKVGSTGPVTFHAVNNYFDQIGGHDFDISDAANVLIEGNVFENVTTPITSASATEGGHIFNVPTAGNASTCQAYLGRACEPNSLADSGAFAAFTDTGAFTGFDGTSDIADAIPADQVASSVVANAGVGKLADSAVSSRADVLANADALSSNGGPGGAVSYSSLCSSWTSTVYITNSKSTSTLLSAATTSGPAASSISAGTVGKWYQCGGTGFSGAGDCVRGTTCTYQNEFYSRCL